MIFQLMVLQKLLVSSTWKYLYLYVLEMLRSQSDEHIFWYLCAKSYLGLGSSILCPKKGSTVPLF